MAKAKGGNPKNRTSGRTTAKSEVPKHLRPAIAAAKKAGVTREQLEAVLTALENRPGATT
jgi:hypothetical protein